ncbi:mechanosensitive ion channel family protein [Alkanindiges illinoisensis]|uniref:Mechanosensitive ion channel family protein n=1 Tax=Alkanindiges illinoisensis TaxID=197183 RepID=A0A4Y7XEN6_9GAMM|nr:mechanosensitive ion channel family protein [Alkanindiges illinoisensis]TEU30205.1 mechanosensitive ion channel family protein [Alkanindiges illinoisensis]
MQHSELWNRFAGWLDQYDWMEMLLGLGILLLVAWIANWLAKHVIVRGVRRFSQLLPLNHNGALSRFKVIDRFANIVPALVIKIGIAQVPHLSPGIIRIVGMLAQAWVFITIVLTISAALNVVNELYQRRPVARNKPIKGYLQLVKIVLFIVCALLIVGTFLQKDIFTLLAGFGAMAAVLMLVFQNTILSLVASVQISSYDMVRLGDWITMPGLNADGDVIDMSLNTIKVQNFDKTITTIPTNRLITDTFMNWRGMSESGGRRIKRAILLDQTSVHFLDNDEYQHLKSSFLLDKYLDEKNQEIAAWNESLGPQANSKLNQRALTNLGTFRAYIQNYLQHHPGIHQEMTLLVRQLEPTAQGLPLEIYCFSNSTDWAFYENVQSDIFDHLLAILPEFGLRVFQQPSGADLTNMGLVSFSASPETTPMQQEH